MTLLNAALSALLFAMLSSSPALGAQGPDSLPGAPNGTLVVAGRVTSLDARWDDQSHTIHTYVALDIARALLGTNVPARLVLEQLGGEVGGIGMRVAEQALFRVGEDVLVVLTASPRVRSLHTVGLGRGKWTLDTGAVGGAAAGPAPSPGRASPTISIAEAERLLASSPHQALQIYDVAPPEYATFSRQPAPAFVFLPTGGDPARWHEVDVNVPVSVDHPTALPATWTGGATANATAAINLWRNSGMDLDLRDGGNTLGAGQCSASFTGNGRIAVSYNDPCGGVADWVVGGGYYTTGDLRTVNGTTFQKFIQGFVILDDTGPQTSSAGCFQDAVTHGLGHALGLGHTTSTGAMMLAAPRSNCASGAAALGTDDRTGITAIYSGIATGPFPPDAPTNFSVTAALSTVALSWTPATSGGPAQRYLVDAGTAPGVYNLGSTTFPASTTSTSVGGVPMGTYYLRVRAQNAIGTSPPTAERSATVGACTPPGPPGTLTGSSADTLVNLQWSAPSTGVTQGYQLAVGTAPGLANLGAQNYAASVTALSGPAPYGTYFARVLATNVCGVSPPSNEVTLVVQPCAAAPRAPTGLAISKSGTFLTITWSAPAGTPPTSYTLAVGSAPGLSNLAVLPTGNTGTSLAGNAPPGTYYVRVIAQNACGASGPSNEFLVTVP